MASGEPIYLTETAERLLQKLARLDSTGYFDGGFTGGAMFHRPMWNVVNAKTSADHAPDTIQTVHLCGPDWVVFSDGYEAEAVNDSLVTIPSGTRLYLIPGDVSWRIVSAFLCSDPEPA